MVPPYFNRLPLLYRIVLSEEDKTLLFRGYSCFLEDIPAPYKTYFILREHP